MKIRVTHAIKNKEKLEIDTEGLLSLSEGIAVLAIKRPILLSLLKRILLES
jgi:hypothetical protein